MSRFRMIGVATASALAAASLTLAGQAAAGHGHDHGHDQSSHHAHAVPAPPVSPTSDDQIQNIDQVKTAIKGYYGDTATSTPDPVNGATTLHTFNPDGAYAHQVERIADQARHFLKKGSHSGHSARHSGQRAILLDVDDTSLNTYNYEIYSNFVYNPTTNGAFVNGAAFPAVPGMADLATWATSHGYTLFFLTGRPEAQRAGTTTNLANADFPAVPADQLYLKDQTKPWLSTCAPSCTTIQYKSLTRQHIESLGYDIVANFGDQYSDLTGGFADRTVKIPNPMYYLP